MKVFIDSGVFIAAFDNSDKYHEIAKKLLYKIINGEYTAFTSDYILAETLTIILYEVGYDAAMKAKRAIVDSPNILLLGIIEPNLNKAL